MYFTIVLLILYVTVVLHELGHFVAMRRKEVGIAEVGAGLPLGPRFSYEPKSGSFAGIRFSFFPLAFILGAVVKETREGAKKMSTLDYRSKALIFGAGPLANLIIGCVLLIVYSVLFVLIRDHTLWGFHGWLTYFSIVITKPDVYIPLVAIPLLWFGRKQFCVYLAPIVSAFLAIWVVRYFMSAGFSGAMSQVVGPIGFYTVVSQEVRDIAEAIHTVAMLSIFLGAINFLPIFPLDGGLLYMSILEKFSAPLWLKKSFKFAGLAIFVIFLVLVLGGDVVSHFFTA